LAQARAWYEDPAHEPLKTLRRSGAAFDLQVIEGL
jgi:uncharacterized protein (DUF1330 family)